MSLLERAWAILEEETLCDRCLGRCFARRGTGLTNEARGRALRVALAMEGGGEPQVEPEVCSVCRSVFVAAGRWAERALERAREYEFRTYLFGTRVPPELEEAERAVWARHGIDAGEAEPLKQEFSREAGKRFGRGLERQGRPAEVDFREPEIAFLIDLVQDGLEMTVKPLYIYGRYRKLTRGIPQTRWPCRACRGRGCERCSYTGKQYPTSVEELVAGPALEAAGGEGHAFHGAGREDIDALMLGGGRPFVLEIEGPRARELDLPALAARINERARGQVAVGRLRFVRRSAVEELKALKARKTYRAQVAFGQTVTPEGLRGALSRLVGEVEQRTPRRVSHRRADRVRTRRVHEAQGHLTGERTATVELVLDGGVYVKELVSGDEGRTRPNLAELLGVPAQVTELDVLEVHGPFPDGEPKG